MDDNQNNNTQNTPIPQHIPADMRNESAQVSQQAGDAALMNDVAQTDMTPQALPAAAPQSEEKNASLRSKIQEQVVEMITRRLEEGTLTEDRAREIAQIILQKLPDQVSEQELMLIIPKLDDEFAELKEVVLPIVVEYETKLRKVISERAIQLIRAKKFQEALDLAKKGIEYSKQLG